MVYGGKTHVLPPCFVSPSSLVNLFNVLIFVSWGQLLHEEMWAWENVGFGGLLSVWTVRMPSGEPSFLSHWSSFSPGGLVSLTSSLFSPHAELWSVIPHAEGMSVHPRVHRMVRSFLMVVSSPHAGRVVHSHAVCRPAVAFFPLSQRLASCSLVALPSHAARRGAAYLWSFTFSIRVESGMFFPVICAP